MSNGQDILEEKICPFHRVLGPKASWFDPVDIATDSRFEPTIQILSFASENLKMCMMIMETASISGNLY